MESYHKITGLQSNITVHNLHPQFTVLLKKTEMICYNYKGYIIKQNFNSIPHIFYPLVLFNISAAKIYISNSESIHCLF